jgi:hypothetical protein
MNMNRIVEIYRRVDNATYGLAELLVVGSASAAVAISLYFVLAGIVWCLLTIIDIFF